MGINQPNALGNRNSRRIPVRQRILHPSMLFYIDLSANSNSDPGQSGALSPYCELNSMYFDNSLYENEMHFKIHQLLDKFPLDDDYEEISFRCKDEDEYNTVLDALFKEGENKFKISGVSNNPMEIIVEKDPRDSYRTFDESMLMEEE